jgi:glycosyltransferase involved in cell wall biosynthesis
MRPLSILFTNNTLKYRAGSELWVRDVCRTLIGRGHRPVAFSLVLGEIAEELRVSTVPVVSNLDKAGFTPDVIHGHHHIETLIAALHYPGVPIVHFCHGFLPWEERPLHHPSIARYVAVDSACFDRLTVEEGIAPERIERLPNFVDLRRFAPRGALPLRPRRALVLSNQVEPGGYIEMIREACQLSGIELEVAGARWGRVVERPEELMAGVDLVFAKAKTALEAMAVGCAVVLADIFGAGPLVTMRDFDEMRSCNFGIRLLREPHSVDWYRSQIAAYDPAEADDISRRVRQDAALDKAVDHLLEIYERAIADAKNWVSRQAVDLEAQRAAARHLSLVAERFKHVYRLDRTVQSLTAELTTARSLNERLVEERESLRQLVTDYRGLSIIRLRDTLVRVPILGGMARWTARWLR